MQNEGRAEAFMARSTISQLSAAGIDTQRCAKLAAPRVPPPHDGSGDQDPAGNTQQRRG